MLQTQHDREVLQLVEIKGLREDVGHMSISLNKQQFHFTIENSLVHKVVMHFDVLHPSIEEDVFSELNAAEIVTIDCHWIGNFHLQILQQPFEPYGFCKELRAEASMMGVRVCERKREREEVTLMNTKRNGG